VLDGEEELGSGRRGGLTGVHGAVGGVEAEHLRDLFGLVLLGAAEDVRLGALGVGELVNESHRAEGDQTNKRVGREQLERRDKRLAQSLELILVDARVDNVEEDGGHSHRPGEGVLDGGVLWQQLGWEVGLRDVLVVGRERVALVAERAVPHLSANVDRARRVSARCRFE
jgi:hypothetical protein